MPTIAVEDERSERSSLHSTIFGTYIPSTPPGGLCARGNKMCVCTMIRIPQ